jgi:general secretion pathway protein G
MKRKTGQKTAGENEKKWMARGFTLVEILIVVIILGILAAIVIPNVSNASMESKEAMLKENLRVLKTQIGVFRAQHGDVSPGYPNCDIKQSPAEETFVAQMTMASNANGETAATNSQAYPYGPYFREMPANPFNKLKTVEVLADGSAMPGAGDDSHGWIFSPQDIVFHADNAGVDSSDKSYFDY